MNKNKLKIKPFIPQKKITANKQKGGFLFYYQSCFYKQPSFENYLQNIAD